jgi:hypothetical protein
MTGFAHSSLYFASKQNQPGILVQVSVRISNPDESALPQTGSGSSPRVSALEPSKSTIIVEEETSGFLLNRNGMKGLHGVALVQ